MSRLLWIGAAACVMSLMMSAFLGERIERPFYDRLLRSQSWDHTPAEVVVVLIDQGTLDSFRNWDDPTAELFYWPWDRAVYGHIARYLESAGAKSFLIDLLLSERIRSSDDAVFGDAIRETEMPIVLPAQLGEGEGTGKWPHAVEVLGNPEDLPFHVGDAGVYGPGILPLPEFMEARLGFSNAFPDGDKVIRRARLLARGDSRYFPSLSLAAVMAASKEALPIKVIDQTFHLGPHSIPLDADGLGLIPYREGRVEDLNDSAFPVISAASLIKVTLHSLDPEYFTDPGDVDSSLFKDRIVLLGTNAAGLFDLKGTPLSQTYPGVMVHATMIQALLDSQHLRMSTNTVGWSWTILVALLVVVMSLTSKKRGLSHLFGGLIAIAASLVLACFVFLKFKFYLPVGTPLVVGIMTYAMSATTQYLTEGKLRRQLTGLFEHYVPAPVVKKLVDHPDQVNIAGERREITVLFSDIKGFTSISNREEFRNHPERLTGHLNEYLTVMTEAIHAHGGTIDKYIGDAVVAIFNAPLAQENHPLAGCRAALLCQEMLREFNQNSEKVGLPVLKTRIGISTGAATVGNVGSKFRLNYTAIGQAVNLGARYEAANKVFGTWLMTGEETALGADGGVVLRDVDLVRLPGIDATAPPVRLYEIVATPENVDASLKKRIDDFSRGLELYRGREFKQALDVFRSLEGDSVAELYVKRSEAAIENEPPPGEIVHELTVK